MKKFFFVLLAVVLLIAALAAVRRPLAVLLIKKNLGRVCPGSRITIGSLELDPFRRLTISDLTIEHPASYSVHLSRLEVGYTPVSLFRRTISRLTLAGAQLSIATPRRRLADFPGLLNLKSRGPGFFIQDIRCDALRVQCATEDVSGEAALSFDFDRQAGSFRRFEAQLTRLKAAGAEVEQAVVSAAGAHPGTFRLEKISFGKLKITHAGGTARLQGLGLYLDLESARFLSGNLAGLIALDLSGGIRYSFNLAASDLELEILVNDFEWQEKFRMTGRLTGGLRAGGEGSRLGEINGYLNVLDPGGTLVIADPALLERLAASTRQPLEMVVANFKDYNFDNGVVKLSLEDRDLVVRLDLDGAAGKRSLNAVVHDFKLP